MKIIAQTLMCCVYLFDCSFSFHNHLSSKLLNTKTIIEHSYSRFVSYLQSVFVLAALLCVAFDFWLSLYLFSLIFTYYLVRIVYVVVTWITIRLHQSKQAHSTTCTLSVSTSNQEIPHRQHWHRDIISTEGFIVHLKLLLEFFYIEMEYSQ
jgi:hypothetical protein